MGMSFQKPVTILFLPPTLVTSTGIFMSPPLSNLVNVLTQSSQIICKDLLST